LLKQIHFQYETEKTIKVKFNFYWHWVGASKSSVVGVCGKLRGMLREARGLEGFRERGGNCGISEGN
jgi:hypothetical protein